MHFLLFIFIFGSSLAYGRSYNVLYPLSEDEVMSVSSMASAKEEGLRTLSGDTQLTKEERLIDAAYKGDVEKVQKLLKEGANPKAVNGFGYGLLHYVTNSGVAKVLIAAGADPKVKNIDGETVLHKVANSEVAKVLIAAGADPKAVANDYTALHAATDSEVAKVLIAAGADPKAVTAHGYGTLHFVKDSATAKVLIAAGADPNAMDKDGQTPLHLATDVGVAKVLLAAGAKLDAKSTTGQTPLHLSVILKRLKLTRFYLEKGVDPNIKDKDGKIPPDYADSKEMKEIFLYPAEASCKGAFNN